MVDVSVERPAMEEYTGINPEKDTLHFANLFEAHINKKIDEQILEMNNNSKNYDNVTTLFEAVVKAILKDEKFVDFNKQGFEGVKQLIDDLHAQGILDATDIQDYKIDTTQDLQLLKAKLEGLQSKLRNQSQIPLIKLQPLMNLLELMTKIAKAIIDNWAHFKGHVNSQQK